MKRAFFAFPEGSVVRYFPFAAFDLGNAVVILDVTTEDTARFWEMFAKRTSDAGASTLGVFVVTVNGDLQYAVAFRNGGQVVIGLSVVETPKPPEVIARSDGI